MPSLLQPAPCALERHSLYRGLVAYWRFEEASGTRYDASGHGNNLTSNNAVGQTAGVIKNAASFVAASSQYLSIPSNSSLQMGGSPFSLSAWVKLTGYTGTPGLVGKWTSTGNLKEYLLFLQSPSYQFEFSVTNDGIGAGAARSNVTASNFGTLPLNTWTFVYCQYDGTNLGISVNDTAMQTAACSGVASLGAAFEIGADGNAGSNLDGAMDEVGLWRRILSPAEVAILYNAGRAQTYPFFGGT